MEINIKTEERRKLGEERHGMSARAYAGKLAANKRYRQRNPEKLRAYKKARRERAKALREQGRGKVEVEWEGCCVWTGGLNEKGYGMVRTDCRTKRRAHRVIWEKYKGKIVAGMVLHHKCRNRRCCNPEHLEMVTRAEHVALHMERPTSNRCGKGHEFTPENTYIRTGGARVCRKCANEGIKDWKARHPDKQQA